jgi:hypothetical protein
MAIYALYAPATIKVGDNPANVIEWDGVSKHDPAPLIRYSMLGVGMNWTWNGKAFEAPPPPPAGSVPPPSGVNTTTSTKVS